MLAYDLKRFEDAIEAAKRCLLLNPPKDIAISANCRLTYALNKRKKYEEGINIAEKAIKDGYEDDALYYNYVTALVNFTHYEKALEVARNAVLKYPKDVGLQYQFGCALLGAKRHEEAIKPFLFASQMASDPGLRTSSFNSLAVSYRFLGDLEEAIKNYVKALELDPHNVTTLRNVGVLKEKLGRTPEAIENYRRAIQLDPNCIPAHYDLAFALIRNGDMENAAKELNFAYKTTGSLREQETIEKIIFNFITKDRHFRKVSLCTLE